MKRPPELSMMIVFTTILVLVTLAVVPARLDALLTFERGAPELSCYAMLGHCAEAWIAIGTMGLFLATVVLVVVGLYQAIEIRAEGKLDRTLSAAERYFFDPIVDRALRRLRVFRRVWSDPRGARIDVQTVLSQLDGLAYGIEAEIYDEEHIRKSMMQVFAYHVVMHMSPLAVARFDLDLRDFRALIRLDRAWCRDRAYMEAKDKNQEFVLDLISKGEWGQKPPN